MKKSIFAIMLICSLTAHGQNHVSNPSFEDLTHCPELNNYPWAPFDWMKAAVPWASFGGSPDLFNSCVTDPNSWVDVPFTDLGYQNAYQGVGFAGFGFTRNFNYINTSFEIFGCPLTEPLIIGERYFVSIRVSVSDTLLYAVNHIGVLFLTQGYDALTDPMPFPNRCHVCTDTVIDDYLGWTEISGVIEADSAYTHLAIGNFLDSTIVIDLPGAHGGPNGTPYYFVDYVCVVPEGGDCSIPLSTSQPHQSAAFTAYPNPIIKSQSSVLHFSKESSIEVYDLMGQKMGHYENVMEVDAGGWPAGVYLLKESGGGVTKVVVME